jgi:hypothetical protein
MLATVSSLLGSIWFGFLLGVCGYLVGSAFPITRFMDRK